jgi:sucrose-6-phosphate hydrolase SacC (GH32 family)
MMRKAHYGVTAGRLARDGIALAGALALAACGGALAAPDRAPDNPPAAATAAAPAGIAHWPFDEGRGSKARERVSGRDDGIGFVFNRARFKPSSDPLWRAAPACISGTCLLFDGYSTELAAPGLSAAQAAGGLTLSAWVAPHAFEWGDGDRYSAVLSQYDEKAGQGFVFGIYRFGSWGVKLGFGASAVDVRVRDRKLPRDQWSHIAASWEPSTRTVRLFLNGMEVASRNVAAGSPLALPMRSLSVGRHSEPMSTAGVFQFNTFHGLLDEVRVGSGAAGAAALQRLVSEDLRSHGGKPPLPSPADMTVARSVFDGDRYRPQYHAMPDSGWMNEPHAPLYYKGQYHLFFQKNPFGPFWHQIHWGHWTSPDMVHWRELPIALAPEDDSLAPDGIWSGSASYREDGTPVLFFTAGNDSVAVRERTGMATPQDTADLELKHWAKHPAPVTLQQSGPGYTGDFRDPFVFRDAAGKRWFQLVGSRIPGGSGMAMVHESKDLLNWTYRGPLFTIDAGKYPGFDKTFELPVLLPLGKGADGRERHVFLADLAAQCYYWIGVFDAERARFIPDSEAPRVFDLGQGHFSGPSGFVDPRTGRSIVMSIAQGERTAQADWDAGWAHNAGLPVELSIGADGDLRLRPIDELKALRRPAALSLRDTSPAAASSALAKVGGDVLEVELELAPAAGVAGKRGLVLRKTPDGAEQTAIYADTGKGRFEIDRSRTTLDPDARSYGVQGGAFELAGEHLRLHVYLDRSMVEAYVNDRKSLTSRVFPARLDALGLDLLAAPGDRVVSLTVWPLNGLDGKPPASVQPAGIRLDPAQAYSTGLPNGGFERCDLSGWTAGEGRAFSAAGISRQSMAGSIPYYGNLRMPDACHFAGAGVAEGDAATGVMQSASFVLGGDGQLNFLLSGGRDSERLYLALVRASDGKELFKATGIDFEQYQRVFWDAAPYIGETLYLKAVDRSTSGHLNLDSINVPVARLVK